MSLPIFNLYRGIMPNKKAIPAEVYLFGTGGNTSDGSSYSLDGGTTWVTGATQNNHTYNGCYARDFDTFIVAGPSKLYLYAETPASTPIAITPPSGFADGFCMFYHPTYKRIIMGNWNSAQLHYSNDGGYTWNNSSSSTPGAHDEIAYNRNNGNMFMITRDGATGFLSSDGGITWSSTTIPNLSTKLTTTWGNGYYYVTGYNTNQIYRSTDASNWSSAITLPFTNGVMFIGYFKETGMLVAGETTGKIAYSADGTNWTLASTTLAGNPFVRRIRYSPSQQLYYAATSLRIYKSANLSTWTQTDAPQLDYYNFIIKDTGQTG